MAGEIFTIKRNWNDVIIRVYIKEGEHHLVECPQDAFIDRLEKELINQMPYVMRSEGQMKKAFREAWNKITKELKADLIKVA